MREMKLPQLLYTVAFMILSLKNILDSSGMFNRPEWVDTILLLAFFGIMIWKLATQTYTWKRILIFIGFGFCCIYTCFSQSYFYILFSFLGIIGMQDVDLKEVVKRTSMVKASLILMHVLYFIFMFITSYGNVPMIWRNGVGRYFFYLGHPNTFSAYILWTTLELAYAYYDKLSKGKLLGLYLINVLFYQFTNSNTGIMVSTIVFFVMICHKAGWETVTKQLKNISCYIMLVLAIIIPAMVVVYPKLTGTAQKWFLALDDFFTGRLMYGAFSYDTFGATLLGQSVYLSDKVVLWRGHWMDSLIFDNAYLWMFCKYGYIYMIILVCAYWVIGKKASTMDRIMIISIALYGIMEAYIINAAICFPILLLGKYIYQNKEGGRSSENEKQSEPVLQNIKS